MDLSNENEININGFSFNENELLKNLEKLHTTELGVERIIKNLSLNSKDDLRNIDVVEYCKMKIKSPNASIERKGKNWYITIDGEIITVNANSYTIITAHKVK